MLRFAAPRVRHLSSSTRSWQMLPSGARWTLLKASEEPEPLEVQSGQVVRVEYTARTDDGRK